MESFLEFSYVGLFVASFLAATILPLSSELVLSGLLWQELNPFVLVGVATFGNVLGSLTNYGIGYWASQEKLQAWLKLGQSEFDRSVKRYQKFGLISLCFAWVPVIGDPVTVVAGVLRVRLIWFLLLVTFGKGARYVLIAYWTMSV